MAGSATWVRVSVLALALVVAGCGHWPFHRHAPAAPVPVHELEVTGAAPDTYPQYWRRNTLLLDLSAASGSGSITVKPAAGGSWPVRLALRVTPGAVGMLEVRAAQRSALPITPAAGKPVDLELPPGVYTPTTPQLTVSWGPAATPLL
jgi:hypothetical protein